MGLKEIFTLRGYEFLEVQSREEAVSFLRNACNGRTVAFGGSMTVKELNLYEELNQVASCAWHWEGDPAEAISSAEFFITSANALSETGEIVNIDGNGNRVAGSIYGHSHVFFVVGENKLCPDLSSAWERARTVAAPMNAKRLNRNTPCAVDGRCHDCQSEQCICSILTVLRRKPGAEKATILLVHETLGY